MLEQFKVHEEDAVRVDAEALRHMVSAIFAWYRNKPFRTVTDGPLPKRGLWECSPDMSHRSYPPPSSRSTQSQR